MKVLIVRLSSLGDVVHALPIAANAHRAGNRVFWVVETAYRDFLAADPHVEAVVVFEEDSPAALLSEIRPDVHAKGTDYTRGSVPERDVVAQYGGKTVIVGDPKNHATTDLIERIRKLSAVSRNPGHE